MRAPRRLWPDARQTLLLRAALAPAPEAARAWSQLTGAMTRAALDTWLATLDRGSKRLVPLVWSNLTRQGVQDESVSALAVYHQSAHDAVTRLLHDAGNVLETFADAGIPTLVLKGGALIGRVYDDLAARPVSDLDVLVPYPLAVDAANVLRAIGFHAESPMTPAALRFSHAVEWKRAGTISVDLHWHVYEECCRPDDDDDLWAASTAAEIGSAPTRLLAVEDQLIHVCVHGEKWVMVPGFRWVADAVVILRRCTVNWDRFVDQAVRRRFALRLRAQLAYLAEAFDAPIPPEVFSALAATRPSALERFEHRFGVRDRRRPWALVYWCNLVRTTRGGVLPAALTFPQYLQAIWRLESLADVPRAGASKVWRRFRQPSSTTNVAITPPSRPTSSS